MRKELLEWKNDETNSSYRRIANHFFIDYVNKFCISYLSISHADINQPWFNGAVNLQYNLNLQIRIFPIDHYCILGGWHLQLKNYEMFNRKPRITIFFLYIHFRTRGSDMENQYGVSWWIITDCSEYLFILFIHNSL